MQKNDPTLTPRIVKYHTAGQQPRWVTALVMKGKRTNKLYAVWLDSSEVGVHTLDPGEARFMIDIDYNVRRAVATLRKQGKTHRITKGAKSALIDAVTRIKQQEASA